MHIVLEIDDYLVMYIIEIILKNIIHTPPDAERLTRKTRSSLIQQNTGTSPLHQEAYTTH